MAEEAAPAPAPAPQQPSPQVVVAEELKQRVIRMPAKGEVIPEDNLEDCLNRILDEDAKREQRLFSAKYDEPTKRKNIIERSKSMDESGSVMERLSIYTYAKEVEESKHISYSAGKHEFSISKGEKQTYTEKDIRAIIELAIGMKFTELDIGDIRDENLKEIARKEIKEREKTTKIGCTDSSVSQLRVTA